jgi:hypothetical protein
MISKDEIRDRILKVSSLTGDVLTKLIDSINERVNHVEEISIYRQEGESDEQGSLGVK